MDWFWLRDDSPVIESDDSMIVVVVEMAGTKSETKEDTRVARMFNRYIVF